MNEVSRIEPTFRILCQRSSLRIPDGEPYFVSNLPFAYETEHG
jgi:hypothetical protein